MEEKMGRVKPSVKVFFNAMQSADEMTGRYRKWLKQRTAGFRSKKLKTWRVIGHFG
jgi:hypothetical protein